MSEHRADEPPLTHPTQTLPADLLERLRRATIGRYDIYAELGSGGMATVFLARDLALDRKVAIKVMAPALAATADAIERFRREARLAAALSHPHIIPIHAIGEEPGLAYYVMKFVEGRTLDSVLRTEGAQSPDFVRAVVTEVGGALHYAHQRGVVHRDIKPANIMVDTDGWLVVTDFGIAKRDDAQGLTQSGMIIGTPFYMSPEQFNGQPVTGAADQYALGIVAYELLAGRTPFGGPSIGEVMKGHLMDPVPPLREVRPDVPPDLEAAIARMLDKEPAQRFATLAEAAQAVGRATPSAEQDLRTQIIALARTGARLQPQMAVPASPAVQARPEAGATGRAPGGTEERAPSGRTGRAPVATEGRTRPLAAPTVSPAAARGRRRGLWALAGVALAAVAIVVGGQWRAAVRPGAGAASSSAGAPAGGPPARTASVPTTQSQPARDPGPGAATGDATPPDPAPGRGAATPPAAPTREEPPANPVVTAAESLAAAAEKALRDSIAAAAQAVRNRILGGQRRTGGAGAAGVTLDDLGLVRIGSTAPRTTIQVNNRQPRLLGSRGPQNIPLPEGNVRLILRAPNCAPFDTTVTVRAGARIDLGNRTLRCR